jgi:signal peptidase I
MKKEKIINKIKELLPYIIIIVIVLVIRTYFYTPIKVNGTSMYPTLKPNELMILNKIGLKDGINRWDIVVVKEDNKYIIKRVIGLPNESIAYIDGKLYINKKEVEDNYSLSNTDDFSEIYLKDNEYFVMGDNRAVSADSRTIGPVEEDQILGKTSLVIYPFNKIGKVQ